MEEKYAKDFKTISEATAGDILTILERSSIFGQETISLISKIRVFRIKWAHPKPGYGYWTQARYEEGFRLMDSFLLKILGNSCHKAELYKWRDNGQQWIGNDIDNNSIRQFNQSNQEFLKM